MSPPRAASPARIERFLADQRWYAAGNEAPHVASITRAALDGDGAVSLAIVELVDGAQYQLVQCDATPDKAAHPKAARALAELIATEAVVDAGEAGRIVGHVVAPVELGSAPARLLGAEQSNTSSTVGGTHVLKVLRRLQPGLHPEVELGRHLATAPEAPVARLAGWCELVAPDGTTTTLAVLHELVPGALDGWSLALSALAADPSGFLARLHDLGASLARLHGALAAMGASPLDPRTVWALGDELLSDPEVPHDARHLVAHAVEAIGADAGPAIRIHGDLHLGQTVVGPDGWVILDFEGEPARPLEARRIEGSPLRDVAGMLRSLAYAAAAHARADGRPLPSGWEPAARAALLDGYLEAVDPALVPRSASATAALLELHELQKAAYEVRYELAHRPDWVDIPRQALARIAARRP